MRGIWTPLSTMATPALARSVSNGGGTSYCRQGITNTFALLRLLPGGERDKDAEILALRHQLAVLQRQLDGQRVRFEAADILHEYEHAA